MIKEFPGAEKSWKFSMMNGKTLTNQHSSTITTTATTSTMITTPANTSPTATAKGYIGNNVIRNNIGSNIINSDDRCSQRLFSSITTHQGIKLCPTHRKQLCCLDWLLHAFLHRIKKSTKRKHWSIAKQSILGFLGLWLRQELVWKGCCRKDLWHRERRVWASPFTPQHKKQ